MSYTLRQVGKVWHYRFQIDGVRIQKSTKEKSRNKAVQIADEAFQRAKLVSRGKEPIPTFTELADLWMGQHKPIMSEHYIRVVETICRLHVKSFANERIDLITTETIENARIEYLKRHARYSANTWINALSVLFHWAIKRKVIKEMPWAVARLKVQKRPRITLTAGMIPQFLDAIDQTETHGIKTGIRLMLGLGLRESEALTARWEWIDWKRKTYTPGKTKGFEAVAIPIAPWLCVWLADLARSRKEHAAGHIVIKAGGGCYGRGFASPSIKRAGTKVGIEGLTPHRLRGTYATLLSEQGVSVQNIQHVMRHKDALTTMKYLEINLDEVRRGANEISNKTEIGGEKVANDNGISSMNTGLRN